MSLHKHRSRMVTQGFTCAPHRAFLSGHDYDGLVAMAGCDKTLPAMMMAITRLNVPPVFLYGGATLLGQSPKAAS